MTEVKAGWKSRLPVAIWLTALTVLAIIKIVVGSLFVTGGCLGFALFPYFLLIGGFLALAPASMAAIMTFTKQSRDLKDMWDLAAKLFFFLIVFLLAGTVYTLVCSARATHLNRLCSDSWVVVLGLCVVALDWALLAVFFRLFCVHSVPPPTKPTAFEHEFAPSHQSPFYVWKNRRNFHY